MAKNRYIGKSPVIGIRPIIGGRKFSGASMDCVYLRADGHGVYELPDTILQKGIVQREIFWHLISARATAARFWGSSTVRNSLCASCTGLKTIILR